MTVIWIVSFILPVTISSWYLGFIIVVQSLERLEERLEHHAKLGELCHMESEWDFKYTLAGWSKIKNDRVVIILLHLCCIVCPEHYVWVLI